MKLNSFKNNTLQGEAIGCQMYTTVRLADGTLVRLPGAAPKGSIVAFTCTDITRSGAVLGYQGWSFVEKPVPKKPAFSEAADAVQPTLFTTTGVAV